MRTASLILSIGSNDFPLSATELKIGRDPQNEVVLADDSVSVFHSVFAPSPHGVVLKDLDTTNGTFVNGRRIKETFIELGDQIRFGSVEGLIAAPQQPAVKDVLCPHCGADVAAESKFCIACGIAMVNQPEEVVEKDTVKPAFSWWPSNQLGASVLTALFVLIFSSWTYQPLGTIFMLAVVFSVSIVIRYAYHRLSAKNMDRQSTEHNVPAALWKRWPVRVGLFFLILEVPLLNFDEQSQGHLRSEYTAKMYAIEQEASLHGESIDSWKNEDPFKSLALLVRRDGNDHDFGQSTWVPANPQQQYFEWAGRRKVAIQGQTAAHQGLVMISIALLFMFGYLLYDGLEAQEDRFSKVQKLSALLLPVGLVVILLYLKGTKAEMNSQDNNLHTDNSGESNEKQTREAWAFLVNLLNTHLELLEYNMSLQMQGKPHLSEQQLLASTENLFRGIGSMDQTGVDAVLTLYLDRLSEKAPLAYQQLAQSVDRVKMAGDNFTIQEAKDLQADIKQAFEKLSSATSGLNFVHKLLSNKYGPGFQTVKGQNPDVDL